MPFFFDFPPRDLAAAAIANSSTTRMTMMYCRLPSSRSEIGDSPSPEVPSPAGSDGVSWTSPTVYSAVIVLVMPEEVSVMRTVSVCVPSAGRAGVLLISVVFVAEPSPKSQTYS